MTTEHDDAVPNEPTVSEEFSSPYLSATALPTDRDVIDTIVGVDNVEMFDPKTKRPGMKWVVHLESLGKGLVLGTRSKAMAIAQLHGDSMMGWIGKPIALRAEGKVIDDRSYKCLKIQPYVPKPTQAPKWGDAIAARLAAAIGKHGLTREAVLSQLRIESHDVWQRLDGLEPTDWPNEQAVVSAVNTAIESAAAAKQRRDTEQVEAAMFSGDGDQITEDDIPF